MIDLKELFDREEPVIVDWKKEATQWKGAAKKLSDCLDAEIQRRIKAETELDNLRIRLNNYMKALEGMK